MDWQSIKIELPSQWQKNALFAHNLKTYYGIMNFIPKIYSQPCITVYDKISIQSVSKNILKPLVTFCHAHVHISKRMFVFWAQCPRCHERGHKNQDKDWNYKWNKMLCLSASVFQLTIYRVDMLANFCSCHVMG